MTNNTEHLCRTETPIDESLIVSISDDKLYGLISFTEPSIDGKKIALEEIYSKISKFNITYGIDHTKLEELSVSHEHNTEYIIATGTPPIDGINAFITPMVELPNGTLSLQENDFGNVDFKNLNLIKNITKGTLIATKTPLIDATNGISVTGKPILAKKPRDVKLLKTKNTYLSEDGLSLFADIDGQVMYSGGVYDVLNTLVIDGDVDASVGNIDFLGNILVTGTVKTGYSVKTPKSIEVRGSVEAASLHAGEDIILTRGIQGGCTGKLFAGRNILSRFIENCSAVATCNIISESIIQSKVEAGDSIIVQKGKGVILGGSAKASKKISANFLGGPMEIPTSIRIGLSLDENNRLKELTTEHTEYTNKLSELTKNIDFLVKKQLEGTLQPQHTALLQNLAEMKTSHESTFANKKQELINLSNQRSKAANGHIEVIKTVYPAVTLTVGTAEHTTKDNHDRCKITKEHNEISFNIL